MKRPVLLLLALLLAGALSFGQSRLSVDQLVAFVKSSIGRNPDKQVAQYLKSVKLNYQLEERVIEDLQGLGAGPRTIEALRLLRLDSMNLPIPPDPLRKKVIAPLAGPSAEEQARIIAKARDYALNYSEKLPNYLCLQVTRRYGDPTGTEIWHKMDTVVTRVSYNGEKEDYKVLLVNNTPVTLSVEQLGGSTSTGEFGTMLRELFDPASEADFTWERWATLRGRRTHVFSFRVQQNRSKFSIRYEKTDQIVTAYKGLVYIDRDAGSVMRIAEEADNIPPTFPVQMAKTVLDYDFQDINGASYILPLRADVRMRASRFLTKNETEFRKYQRFSAESDIKFDLEDTAPLPEDKKQEQPAAPPSPKQP